MALWVSRMIEPSCNNVAQYDSITLDMVQYEGK